MVAQEILVLLVSVRIWQVQHFSTNNGKILSEDMVCENSILKWRVRLVAQVARFSILQGGCSLRGSNPLRVTYSELILRLMHPESTRPIKTKLYISESTLGYSILLSLRRVRNSEAQFSWFRTLVLQTRGPWFESKSFHNRLCYGEMDMM